MRTTKSKTQNTQLPNQVVALTPQTKPAPSRYSISEISPVCLIPANKDGCNHKHCAMAYRKPQCFGISISEFYKRHEFSEFDMQDTYGPPHLIPHKPNNVDHNVFEGFRQSQNAVVHITGAWPKGLRIVPREHVEFRWTEIRDSYPVHNNETFTTEWLERLDVKEYGYYIGPLCKQEVVELAADECFELPDQHPFVRVSSPKNWCYCASEGDFCGTGCHQPQNNPALKEGVSNEK